MPSLIGFYTLLSAERDHDMAEVQVRIHADHPVYQGHFPERPVAPGAALTQMVVDEAHNLLGDQLQFSGARQIKFLSVLDPNVTDTLTLRYNFTASDGQQQFSCVGTTGETVFFKMNGAFK